jgi:23S rRNA (cytosine1962-C5)-methyltransferase
LSRIARLVLKEGREKPVLRRHPWIFSGAVQDLEGDPDPGATVEVTDSQGEFLGWGAYSPTSQIRARIWSWNPNQKINDDFFRYRLENALAYRNQIGYDHQMRRLVHAESDGIPGLIVDQYGDYLVVQLLSTGVEFWKEGIVSQLVNLINPAGIYERSDVEVRILEGLEKRTGTLFGSLPEGLLLIEEEELKHWIDIRKGHKTGAYLDQRMNRELVGSQCGERSVLDCFCYSGGFSLQALRHGATSVTLLDNSGEALTLAKKHIQSNDLDHGRVEYQQGDVFDILRGLRDRGRSYDVIILDPPKFAPTAALAQRAARGYKDINLLAMKLLKKGGLLATFSCSGGISREFFLRILSGAALDAGVNARIQSHMGQSMDHSVNLSFPEGTYLKGFAIRVDKEEV